MNILCLDKSEYGKIKRLYIPSSVEIIDRNAFANFLELREVIIENGLKEIRENAFVGCTDIEMEIPASVTKIVIGMHYREFNHIRVNKDNPIYDSRNDCNAIIETATNTLIVGTKSTKIPDTVTTIESSAFQGCVGLTSIKIPNGVSNINHFAFMGCKDLTSIEIPESVIEMGLMVFSNCTNLTTINIRKPEGSITGSPWEATNATINWNYEGE